MGAVCPPDLGQLAGFAAGVALLIAPAAAIGLGFVLA